MRRYFNPGLESNENESDERGDKDASSDGGDEDESISLEGDRPDVNRRGEKGV